MTFLHDFLRGCRILSREKSTSAVAVLSLALGIGANTAVFGLIDTALLRPLTYAAPNRLAMVWSFPVDRPYQHHPASLSGYYAVETRIALSKRWGPLTTARAPCAVSARSKMEHPRNKSRD